MKHLKVVGLTVFLLLVFFADVLGETHQPDNSLPYGGLPFISYVSDAPPFDESGKVHVEFYLYFLPSHPFTRDMRVGIAVVHPKRGYIYTGGISPVKKQTVMRGFYTFTVDQEYLASSRISITALRKEGIFNRDSKFDTWGFNLSDIYRWSEDFGVLQEVIDDCDIGIMDIDEMRTVVLDRAKKGITGRGQPEN